MDTYEAIGICYIILMACIGTLTTFAAAFYGAYRLWERGEIGKKFEREAVCELLEEAGRRRSEIPGVIQP